MVKAVVFDMDGLMLDTETLLTRFWIEAGQFYGFDMKKEHALKVRSLSHELTMNFFKGIFGDSFDYYAVRAKRIELMSNYIKEHGLEKKKGLDELFEYLKTTNLKLGVATATDHQRTEMYLKSVGVYDYFDSFICGDMVKKSKPSPEIYQTASSELGVKCEETIALEDSPNGIQSAFDAGCIPIMVPDLSQPDDLLKQKLFCCCDDLSQVIDIIKKLLSEG